MSNPIHGDAAVTDGFLKDAKALFEAGGRAVAEQVDFLAVPLPEDMAEARAALGEDASRLDVVKEARARRGGRTKGARNRRTDDFARYLLSFGQHPAITMMQIQATPPEVLIEASQQEKVHSFNKFGDPNVVTERLSYEAAQSLRIRCAEGLLPYIESKKPVEVKLDAEGDFNLLIPGVNISTGDARAMEEGTFVLEGEYVDRSDDGEAGDAD